jgi:hypothetical protein
LLVINELNRARSKGEGEAALAAPLLTPAAPSQPRAVTSSGLATTTAATLADVVFGSPAGVPSSETDALLSETAPVGLQAVHASAREDAVILPAPDRRLKEPIARWKERIELPLDVLADVGACGQ